MTGIRTNIGIRRFGQPKGVVWTSYWTSMISATVENASPTHVVLTFASAKSLVAADITCTVNGGTVVVSSASWTGAVWTIVLASAVIYGDVVVMTFVKTSQTKAVINNVAVTSQYLAVYNSFTTKPSDAVKINQNILVNSLVGAGVWAKCDILHIFAAHIDSAAEARVNWINPGTNDATYTGAVTFTTSKGVKGNAGTIRVVLYNPTGATNYSKNSAHFGVGINDDIRTNVNRGAGVINGSNCSFMVFASELLGSVGGTLGAINDGGTPLYNDGSRTTMGFHFLNRSSSSAVQGRKNYGNKANTNNSTNVPNLNLWLGGINNGGANLYGNTLEYNFASAGSSLTATQQKAFVKALNIFMASIGNSLIDTNLDVTLTTNPIVDIMSGQSNIVQGYCNLAALPSGREGIKSDRFMLDLYRGDIAKKYATINTGEIVLSAFWGQEETFFDGSVAFSAAPKVVLKSVYGSQVIDQWNTTNGPLWLSLVQSIDNVLNYCTINGLTPTFRSLLWGQGESNCLAHDLGTYQTKLTNVINAIRAYNAALTNIKVVLMKINTNFTALDAGDITTINAIYDTIAGALSNILILNPNDYVLTFQDNLHYTPASTLTLGTKWSDLINV